MAEHPFTRTGSVAAVVLGILSGCVLPLQAILLPALVKHGHITLAQIGQAAMAQSIGTMIGMAIANAVLRPTGLRGLAMAAGALCALLDLATPHLHGEAVLAVRFIHGLCAGVLLWLWVGFLARSGNPGRWAGIFSTAAAVLATVASTVMSMVLLPWGGAIAGYALIASFYATIIVAATVIPPQYSPLVHARASFLLGPASWAGLGAIFLQVAGGAALWVYLKPYGAQIGMDEATTGLLVSVALGGRIVGGLVATGIAGRIRATLLLLGVVAGVVACLTALGVVRDPVIFIAAACIFSALWTLGPALHVPYLIEIDPSRRTAMHMLTVQLLGAAAGPAFASLAVRHADVGPVLVLAIGLFVVGGVIVAVTGLRLRHLAAASS